MTTWITILSSVGASTFFCTALMWLCREWLSARLKKSIQHEYDVKLEGYKAGYTRFLTENEIRFSRWHEEKLKAIKEIYSELRYLNPLLTANLLEMTMPEKPTSSQQKYRITAKGLELLARNS